MARSDSSRVASNDHLHSALTSLRVSVDSLELTAADSPGNHRRRTVTQSIVIVSLASFVVGVVMTAASFGPLFYPHGQPPVIIVIFQVIFCVPLININSNNNKPESPENPRFRLPHSRLTPPPGNPVNIRINLILTESRVIGLHLRRRYGSITLSSFKFSWWAPKDACVLKQSA